MHLSIVCNNGVYWYQSNNRANNLACKNGITGIEKSLEYVHHQGTVHGRVKGHYID